MQAGLGSSMTANKPSFQTQVINHHYKHNSGHFCCTADFNDQGFHCSECQQMGVKKGGPQPEKKIMKLVMLVLKRDLHGPL